MWNALFFLRQALIGLPGTLLVDQGGFKLRYLLPLLLGAAFKGMCHHYNISTQNSKTNKQENNKKPDTTFEQANATPYFYERTTVRMFYSGRNM